MTAIQRQGRTLSMVLGYLQDNYPPSVAFAGGLVFRFAVILDTYRPDKEGTYFDSELFVLVVSKVCHAVNQDTAQIWTDEDKSVRSFDELSRMYAGTDEDDREPPLRIELALEGQLVAFIETEFWVNVGGPAPYHDSYTASMYTVDDRSLEFQGIVESVSATIDATVQGVHRGVVEKAPYRSWWSLIMACAGIR